MKKILVLVLCTVISISCSDNDVSMEILEDQMAEELVDDMEVSNFAMGDFVDGAHPTSGKATVNSDKTVLSFANFKTDNGPKLLVYLSTDTNSTEYVNLGDLKGVSGNFTYSIPENIDLEKFKIVNIWCVDFSVSFGTAELK
ncbi:DM13 domain-containing protein [Lutibacter flavus]|uniref:Electron transfer DM13 n=1 Tax=Lutibacter flavus TaxID=691689 RepID=A0A238YWT4_9FLAO|nr:DM13 domain-containing protein [Lutibacter flavus]SNR75201.1 Electron transfer DM13 [Lutibacter flavus]